MTRLAIGLALAALLAAVVYVLARPRWRWDSKVLRPVDKVEPPVQIVRLSPSVSVADIERIYSTGSPWSVTSRADNGTGFDAILASPDDAARWAGG